MKEGKYLGIEHSAKILTSVLFYDKRALFKNHVQFSLLFCLFVNYFTNFSVNFINLSFFLWYTCFGKLKEDTTWIG